MKVHFLTLKLLSFIFSRASSSADAEVSILTTLLAPPAYFINRKSTGVRKAVQNGPVFCVFHEGMSLITLVKEEPRFLSMSNINEKFEAAFFNGYKIRNMPSNQSCFLFKHFNLSNRNI